MKLHAMAGLTVGELRWRYARAWHRFVDAIADQAESRELRVGDGAEPSDA